MVLVRIAHLSMNKPQEKTVYLIRVARDTCCKAASVLDVSEGLDGR
jgi:hypothetical protein